MNFRSFYYKKDTVLEVSQQFVDKLPKNLEDKILRKEMPFNNLFGDKLRIAEPLKGGLINSSLVQQIKNVLEYKYIIDFNNWSVYKPNDTSRKNPIRIGKALAKEKEEINKQTEKIKKIIDLHNTDIESFNERMKDNGWNINSLKDQLKWNTTRLQTTDDLLKTTNLEKQIKSTTETDFYIIYSRAPIDVLRMSDFDTKSCHSEIQHGSRGIYFYCALADAMLNAGVIYLVSKDEFEIEGLLEDSQLQKNEIFGDNDRGIDGIKPIARMRLRRVFDKNGKELAVPKTAIYGKINLRNDFINQVRDWVKKQNINDFDFENTLSLVGGSYEDSGHDIASEVRNTWGKVIRYEHDSESERAIRDELSETENYEEENYWEHIRDDLNNIESDNYEKLFETSDWSSESGLDIDINHNNGLIKIQFNIPNETIDLIGKERFIKFSEQQKEIDGWIIQQNTLIFRKPNAVSIYDYGEYYDEYDGSFSQDNYLDACNTVITNSIKNFIGIDITRQSNIPLATRTAFIDRILKTFDIQIQTLDYNEITEVLDDFSNRYEFTYILPEDDLKINLNSSTLKRHDPRSLSGPMYDYWILPNSEYSKLERYYNICNNHIFYTIYDAANFILKISSRETDEEYNDRIQQIDKNVINSVFDIFNIKTTLVIRDDKVSFAKILPANLPDVSQDLKNADNIVISKTYNEKYVLQIEISFTNNTETIVDVTDKNIGKYFYNVLNLLNDAEDDKDIDLFNSDGLDQKIKKYNGYSSLQLNKDLIQRELDLSSINIDMNKFDRYVYKLLQELSYETGGVSNQTGDPLNSQTQHTNTKSGFGMSSISPTKTPSSTNSSTSSKSNVSNNGKVQVTVDLDSVLNDTKMKGQWGNWLKDPNNANALKTQYASMNDLKADPVKRDQFLKTINSDQELSKFISSLGNNQ
jgi:hypothetical protein